jgi:multidrug resistance efflux pump
MMSSTWQQEEPMALYDNSRDPVPGSQAPLDRYGGKYLWLLLAALVAIVLVMSMTSEAPRTTDATKSASSVIEPVTPAPSTTP